MKSNNLWRIIWVVGIYAILIFVLYLVIIYKVKWEDKDPNKYLYIYNCKDTICTTDDVVDDYIASIICDNKKCPHIKEIHNNIIIFSNNEKEYIYDLTNKKVINDLYNKYKFTKNDNYYIAVNNNNLSGIIDNEGKIIVDFTYNNIIDYKDGFILYENNNKYGIDNSEKDIKIEVPYENVSLFNDNLFIYVKDNEYYIASYDTQEPINNSIYDYIYAYKDILLISKNSQIDILDSNLKSKLIMKLNSYYPYKKEQERESLNIKELDNLLRFSLYTDSDQFTNYIYDIKNNKLYN